jgi:hypothetical protein
MGVCKKRENGGIIKEPTLNIMFFFFFFFLHLIELLMYVIELNYDMFEPSCFL